MPTADDSLTPSGSTIHQALDALVSKLNRFHLKYAIIGGQALNQHIRPRGTDDVDAIVLVPQLTMPSFFEALAEAGFTVDLLKNIRELRDDGFTCVLFDDVPVDLMRPLIPSHDHVLQRALPMEIRGQTVQVSSAEGLIVLKLEAMRAQDEADIRRLLELYVHQLDLDFVRRELRTIAPEGDPRPGKLEDWIQESLTRLDGAAGTGAS